MAVSISVSITQNSQNIANNTSNVTVKVTAKWTGGSYNTSASSTSGSYCTIDGTKYSFTSAFNTGQTTSGSATIFTKKLDIPHKADGTKSLTVKASYNTDVSSGTVTATTTKTLTTIPRATEPKWNVSSINLEETLNIIVAGASSEFTHDLVYKYTYDGKTYHSYIGTQIASGNVSWQVPKTIALNLPDATSTTVTIICETYNGTDLVGTKSGTITVKLPTSTDYYPQFTGASVDDVNGHKAKYGDYVQGKSAFNIGAYGKGGYGSSLKDCKFVVDGSTYSATVENVTNGTWIAYKESKVIQAHGSVPIKITAKDGRGRTETKTIAVDVLQYSRPAIASLKAYRCKSYGDGTADDNGAYIRIVAETLVAPLNNKNGNTVQLQYRQNGATSWNTAKTTDSYNYIGTTEAFIEANTELTYDVRVVVTDDFYTSERETSVTSVLVLMDFHKDGKGMAIGKVSEEDYKDHLDIGLPVRLAESNFINVLFSNNRGQVVENKSKFIKPLNLVVIDLRIQVPNVPYAANEHHVLLNLANDIFAPTQLKALSCMQNIENERIYQAAMSTDGSLLMKLSTAITASSYVSIQGCYFL